MTFGWPYVHMKAFPPSLPPILNSEHDCSVIRLLYNTNKASSLKVRSYRATPGCFPLGESTDTCPTVYSLQIFPMGRDWRSSITSSWNLAVLSPGGAAAGAWSSQLLGSEANGLDIWGSPWHCLWLPQTKWQLCCNYPGACLNYKNVLFLYKPL